MLMHDELLLLLVTGDLQAFRRSAATYGSFREYICLNKKLLWHFCHNLDTMKCLLVTSGEKKINGYFNFKGKTSYVGDQLDRVTLK
jgi:hypothetical protein